MSAESKISGVLEQELERVEKECIRPLQVIAQDDVRLMQFSLLRCHGASLVYQPEL